MPRLLIVEEALRDLTAHWFGYISTIANEVERQGWSVDVACHKDVDNDIKQKLNCFPVLKAARYLNASKTSSRLGRMLSPVLHSYKMLVVLWPLLKKNARYDVVFAPTVLLHHLLAWWFISVFHPKRPTKLTLFFVTNPGIWNNSTKQAEIPRSTVILELFLKLFSRKVKNGNVRLAVETEGARREFEQVSGLPFVLMSHPVPFSDANNDDELLSNQNNSLHLACYGFARHEKGSDIFKQAIEELIKQNKVVSLQFTIQWIDAFAMPDGNLCEPGEILRTSTHVTILNRAVDQNEYQHLLRKTDCMILPYRNLSYYARLSRIVIEAACQGIPMIYTKGGWMEDAIQKYGAGLGVEDGSVEDLSHAILTFSKQHHLLLKKAQEQKFSARAQYSPSVFCKLLLDQ